MLSPEAAEVKETIASDTIDSAVVYLSFRRQARPWCTYLTLLLVDAASRIAPIVKHQAQTPSITTYRTIVSMINARDCLKGPAGIKLGVTTRALVRLNQISQDVNIAFSMGAPISRGIWVGHSLTFVDEREQGAVIGSSPDLMPMEDSIFDVSKIWELDKLAELISTGTFPVEFGP